MKLLSYALDRRMEPRLAFSLNGYAVDVMRAALWMQEQHQAREYLKLASSMRLALVEWERDLPLLQELKKVFSSMDLEGLIIHDRPVALSETEILFFSPVPEPPSIRMFNVFEKHIHALYGSSHMECPSLWEETPFFSYANRSTLLGHEQELMVPGFTTELDFGTGVACVIAGGGIDIGTNRAKRMIAGFTIYNDWTARNIQREEIMLGQAPGKSKDFGSSLGPYLVTADEFDVLETGKGFNLEIIARKNGQELTRGNMKNMQFSFPEMISYASENVELLPGDIIHAGTVDMGSLLEARSTADDKWLKAGDTVEIEAQGIGILTTQIIRGDQQETFDR